MGLFKKMKGIIGSSFKIGLAGPQLKDDSGSIAARNEDDTAYVEVKGLAGTTENSFITKKQFETAAYAGIVGRQADTSVSIPNNTASKGLVVVSTPGSGAVLGDLLYDDGSGTGTMEILPKLNGRTIFVTVALTGGNAEFDPDSTYQWDDDASSGSAQWVKIGDIGSLTGPVRAIRFPIALTTPVDSSALIPANARIISAKVEITTPYDSGTTITVGTVASPTAFQVATDNNPQAADAYEVEQDTSIGGSDAEVRVAITNTPAAGAGIVTVLYTNPNA
jgi:hypothetical protein